METDKRVMMGYIIKTHINNNPAARKYFFATNCNAVSPSILDAKYFDDLDEAKAELKRFEPYGGKIVKYVAVTKGPFTEFVQEELD